MKTGTNAKGYIYYICDIRTDLPRYIADTYSEACAWLGCSRPTLSRLLKTGCSYNGFSVIKLKDI